MFVQDKNAELWMTKHYTYIILFIHLLHLTPNNQNTLNTLTMVSFRYLSLPTLARCKNWASMEKLEPMPLRSFFPRGIFLWKIYFMTLNWSQGPWLEIEHRPHPFGFEWPRVRSICHWNEIFIIYKSKIILL